MEPISTRCRLKNRALPGLALCGVLVMVLIQTCQAPRLHRPWDFPRLLFFLLRLGWLCYLTVGGRSAQWTITQGAFGTRMERDGQILFEGSQDQLEIVGEDRGVITFRAADGSTFEFPRRRVFHPILSEIGQQSQSNV